VRAFSSNSKPLVFRHFYLGKMSICKVKVKSLFAKKITVVLKQGDMPLFFLFYGEVFIVYCWIFRVSISNHRESFFFSLFLNPVSYAKPP